MATKRFDRPSASSSRIDSHSSLLVQTAKRQPAAGELVECRFKAGERPRAIRNMRGIVRDEVADQPVDRGRVELAALRRPTRARSSLAHRRRPCCARHHRATGGRPMPREDDVERGDEIGSAVDQRPIEIENDGGSNDHA